MPQSDIDFAGLVEILFYLLFTFFGGVTVAVLAILFVIFIAVVIAWLALQVAGKRGGRRLGSSSY
jgi:hypothetical protein